MSKKQTNPVCDSSDGSDSSSDSNDSSPRLHFSPKKGSPKKVLTTKIVHQKNCFPPQKNKIKKKNEKKINLKILKLKKGP